MGPEFINAKDWRARANATYNHVAQVEKVMSKNETVGHMIDSHSSEERCLDKHAMAIMSSSMLDTYLNFQTDDASLNLDVKSYIKQVREGKPGKTNKVVSITREMEMFVPKNRWVLINNSSVKTAMDKGSDKIVDDREVTHADHLINTIVGGTHGTDVDRLKYHNRAGLMDMLYSGKEYHNLALKFVMLLNQMKVLYTFKQARLQGRRHRVVVNYSDAATILDRCCDTNLVIDCVQVTDELLPILVVLAKSWPQQYVTTNGYSDEKDIYSSITIPGDDLFLFYSQISYSTDCTVAGLVMPPDELWDAGIKLFSALGAVDQLFEVVRDTRGLVHTLNLITNPDGEPEIVSLTYPKSRGTNYLPDLHPPAPFTQASQFISSSASLVLDGMLAMQSMNNLHAVVEQLGLCNINLYGNIERNEKFECVMRDQGFNYCGDKNRLREMVCPWNPIITNSGDVFRRALTRYSKECTIYFKHSMNHPVKTKMMSYVCLPISSVQLNVPPLSTIENLRSDVVIDDTTRTTYRTNVSSMNEAVRTNNWLKGVGSGDVMTFGGLSFLCSDELPPLNNNIKNEFAMMSGTYKLANVVCTLDNIYSRKGATAGQTNTLFVPKEIAEPMSMADSHTGSKTQSARKYSSFSARSQERKYVTSEQEDKHLKHAVKHTYTTMPETEVNLQTLTEVLAETGPEAAPNPPAMYDIEISDKGDTIGLLVGDTLGDGHCGPRAVLQALSIGEDALSGVLTMYGGAINDPVEWEDQSLALLAKEHGRNLIIMNETDNVCYKYDNGCKNAVHLVRTGGDSEHGHYSVARVVKPEEFAGNSKAKKYEANKVINAKIKTDRFTASDAIKMGIKKLMAEKNKRR